MTVSLDLRHELSLQPIDLPVFQPTAIQLLKMLSDADSSIDEIVNLINEDQSLSLQILKIANSPVFLGLMEMNNIKDSVVRLGFSTITNIAMTASLSSLHISANPLVNKIMKELYHHSTTCAFSCRWLAVNTGHADIADRAYMAGLLHDIGKLYLLKALERVSQKVNVGITLDRGMLLDIFSEMHVELGCRIMDHWKIPLVFLNIVANHHTEHFDPEDSLLAIVRLVNLNSRNCNSSLRQIAVTADDLLEERNALKLNDDAWENFLGAMISSSRLIF
ncbi:MAG: HDOD domain-containing protein [Desulfuromonadales bacterium]